MDYLDDSNTINHHHEDLFFLQPLHNPYPTEEEPTSRSPSHPINTNSVEDNDYTMIHRFDTADLNGPPSPVYFSHLNPNSLEQEMAAASILDPMSAISFNTISGLVLPPANRLHIDSPERPALSLPRRRERMLTDSEIEKILMDMAHDPDILQSTNDVVKPVSPPLLSSTESSEEDEGQEPEITPMETQTDNKAEEAQPPPISYDEDDEEEAFLTEEEDNDDEEEDDKKDPPYVSSVTNKRKYQERTKRTVSTRQTLLVNNNDDDQKVKTRNAARIIHRSKIPQTGGRRGKARKIHHETNIQITPLSVLLPTLELHEGLKWAHLHYTSLQKSVLRADQVLVWQPCSIEDFLRHPEFRVPQKQDQGGEYYHVLNRQLHPQVRFVLTALYVPETLNKNTTKKWLFVYIDLNERIAGLVSQFKHNEGELMAHGDNLDKCINCGKIQYDSWTYETQGKIVQQDYDYGSDGFVMECVEFLLKMDMHKESIVDDMEKFIVKNVVQIHTRRSDIMAKWQKRIKV